MTNAEKFEQIFGQKPDMSECPFEWEPDCAKCEGRISGLWDCHEKFWNAEYKGDKA